MFLKNKFKIFVFLTILIIISICITFYKSVVKKDFEIFLPPKGEYPENV